jgi:arabinose-5-phosphate isomerase
MTLFDNGIMMKRRLLMKVIDEIKKVIELEATALNLLVGQIGQEYEEAVRVIQQCQGKVIVSGVGKSGHIGKKIAASLASTGTPAFFMHATEGVHGDLGMVEKRDVVLLISNSGETAEVLNVLPSLEQIGSKCIAITSNSESTLAKACNVAITYRYTKEADHLGLAPTTSSTIVLAIGDALAVTLSNIKDFKKEQFHLYHPGGSLGEQLSKISKKPDEQRL